MAINTRKWTGIRDKSIFEMWSHASLPHPERQFITYHVVKRIKVQFIPDWSFPHHRTHRDRAAPLAAD